MKTLAVSLPYTLAFSRYMNESGLRILPHTRLKHVSPSSLILLNRRLRSCISSSPALILNVNVVSTSIGPCSYPFSTPCFLPTPRALLIIVLPCIQIPLAVYMIVLGGGGRGGGAATNDTARHSHRPYLQCGTGAFHDNISCASHHHNTINRSDVDLLDTLSGHVPHIQRAPLYSKHREGRRFPRGRMHVVAPHVRLTAVHV